MNQKIASVADSLKNELVGFLRDSIAIPSFCGEEGAVIARIRQEMEKIGYEHIWIDPMGNLFGRIGSGSKILAFDGHCDTVGIGNRSNWTVDPFKGDMKEGIIYGRGASDQKGGLAAAIYAGAVLKSIGMPENLSFIVAASVLEEDHEGVSWRYIIEKGGLVPHAVVLTEPTRMTIKIGQRGRMEMKLQTTGVSCHGSTPERGKNAIYAIAPVVQDIKRLNKNLSGSSVLGKGSITVTDIRSTSPSLCAVPDSATIHLDRRLTEGENLETCLQEIRGLASAQKAGINLIVPETTVTSYTGYTETVRAYVPLWLMEQSHPLVRTAKEAYQAQFGRDAQTGTWLFSTNGVATKGVHNIPTIGFGPGSEEHAHTVQDQVKVDDLKDAAAFYAAFANTWAREKK